MSYRNKEQQLYHEILRLKMGLFMRTENDSTDLSYFDEIIARNRVLRDMTPTEAETSMRIWKTTGQMPEYLNPLIFDDENMRAKGIYKYRQSPRDIRLLEMVDEYYESSSTTGSEGSNYQGGKKWYLTNYQPKEMYVYAFLLSKLKSRFNTEQYLRFDFKGYYDGLYAFPHLNCSIHKVEDG